MDEVDRSGTRESRLVATVVRLADTLVAGYDVVELLQLLVDSTLDLFDVAAAGILLGDLDDRLELIASTDESARIAELLQLAAGTGPCVTCFTEGRMVSVPDISTDLDWPEFGRRATELGFRSLHAVPLRLRDTTIGSMNMFGANVGELSAADAQAAQALADVATIGILQERAVRSAVIAQEQLQRALNSRVVIEQAKGVVAYRRGVPMDEAFDLIRRYARENRLGLSSVAEQIVDRTLSL